MIFLLVTAAFIVTGLLIGHLMTARPWWARFRLGEAAGVALVLAFGTRYHRRMLAVVLRARAEAATPPYPLPALLPEKTLAGRPYPVHSLEQARRLPAAGGVIAHRDFSQGLTGLATAVARLNTELAAACRVTASTDEAVRLGMLRADEARARVTAPAPEYLDRLSRDMRSQP